MEARFDGAAALTFIRRFVPAARIVSDKGLTTVAQLPGQELGQMQALFEALDDSLAKLGVKEYGATCTTLEDVFLKINETALERLARQVTVMCRSCNVRPRSSASRAR